jgi:hypothetical protein
VPDLHAPNPATAGGADYPLNRKVIGIEDGMIKTEVIVVLSETVADKSPPFRIYGQQLLTDVLRMSRGMESIPQAHLTLADAGCYIPFRFHRSSGYCHIVALTLLDEIRRELVSVLRSFMFTVLDLIS